MWCSHNYYMKCILYLIDAYLNQGLHFVYVVEAFITLHWKAKYKYMSPFSSMPLVHLHLFFSIKFSYGGGVIT